MQDRNSFNPEKISILDFKMIKSQIDTPETFDFNKVKGHQIDNSLQLAFNLEEKLAKADFFINIKTESDHENDIEANGSFHLIFIIKIENLEELAESGKNGQVNIKATLANVLSTITYSTSRGILLTRLQGTALQNFILPVINPNTLL